MSYLKVTFDEYIDGNNDYSGNNIKKTPKITSNIGINYRNDIGYFAGANIIYS